MERLYPGLDMMHSQLPSPKETISGEGYGRKDPIGGKGKDKEGNPIMDVGETIDLNELRENVTLKWKGDLYKVKKEDGVLKPVKNTVTCQK